jgi:hypothetical protein
MLNVTIGNPDRGPPTIIGMGWLWKVNDRYLAKTHPRFDPKVTSHHRQPLRHPTTRTATPPGSHVTSGNPRSGPARMLTGCMVNAICAPAGMENTNNSAANRYLFRNPRMTTRL